MGGGAVPHRRPGERGGRPRGPQSGPQPRPQRPPLPASSGRPAVLSARHALCSAGGAAETGGARPR
eukprot:5902190-Lingulodinium_polyedra.AAC.1